MPDGHGAPGDGGRPGGGARPTRLVLRRARAQAGLVAMVTALVVAGATVLGLCSLLLTTVRDQALVAAVRGTDPASVQVVAAVTLADDATAADAAARALAEVSDTTQTALAAFPTTTSVWATSTRLLLDPAPDGGLRQTYLLDGDDVAAHATLTAGRWPTSGAAAVTEVALPDSAARLLGVASGSTISLTGAPQHAGEPPADPRTVLVVGTFTPRRGDQAWTRDPLDAAGYATYALGAALPAYGPLVVAPGTLVGHQPVARFSVVLTPVLSGATTSRIATAERDLGGLRRALDERLGERASGVALANPYPETLQQVRAQLGVTASVVLVAALLAGALAGTALGLAARLLADRRAAEHTLLVARGAASRQLAAHAAAEALVLALVAAALSIPLSLAAFRALARIPRLARAGMDAAAAAPTAVLVATVGGAALGLSGVLVVVSLRSRGTRGRAWRHGLVARSGVDLVLVALAVLGYLQLRAHRVALGAAVDPVLVAAPVLCLAAGAVLALRVLPWVARLAEVHAARSSRLVLPLAAWELARRRHSTAGAFLLVLATATTTFGLTFVATWERSQADQADAQVGAQLQVDPGAVAPIAEGRALGAATGGSPMAVTQRSISLGSLIGADTSGHATQLLATDLRAGHGFEVGRPPAGTTWAAATAGLATVDPAGPLLPAGPLRLVLTGDTADGTPVVATPSLVVEDPWGGQAVLDGGPVPLDGAPHELRIATGPDAVPLPDRLRLVALDLGLALGDGAAPSPDANQTSVVTVRTVLLGATAGSGSSDWFGSTSTDPWQIARGAQATEAGDPAGVGVTASATVSLTGLLYESGRLVVVAGSPVADVPVVVTAGLADELGAQPGGRLSLTVGQSQLDGRITGVVPYLPSIVAPRGVLADRTTLDRALLGAGDLSPLTDRWWVSGLADPRAAAAAVTAGGLGAPQTRDAVAAQLRDGPLRMAILAATWLLVAAAALLALWGTAAHVVASIGARAVEVARLLGLGMSRAAVGAALLVQHGGVCLLAVGTGALLGGVVVRLVVPLLVVSSTGAPPVPDVLVVWPWPALAVAVTLLALGSVALAAPVASAAVRRASATHLRMEGQP
ncbi:hypothetical protein [Cellulomonas sp. 73-92]|uniref:hypothetical protein n=1 Tax=Cellulomonas sp. 73-92 TaxID=1895740 RepID=UPI0025C43A2E|nr:hypothetical protein [Cellulomonas sp. 73-92]